MAAYRLMRDEDIPALHELMIECFSDLDRRLGQSYEGPTPALEQSRVRYRRLMATDPEGAWVAESDGGEVMGCGSAIMRDGLWGLSMFMVAPSAQGEGIGRELLRRAVAYGNGVRGRVILASRDPRAIAAYARLGLILRPCVLAAGRPREVGGADGVRPGGADDLPLTEAIDREVRGAAHGEDILAMMAAGSALLVAPERGYALILRGATRLLAARDEEAAAALLRAALAEAARQGDEAHVEWITAEQSWAVPVCLQAGLELRTTSGPLFTGGDVGPFRPYLPNGAYL